MEIKIKMRPFPYTRVTKGDIWKKRPAALHYWANRNELKLKAGSFKLPARYEILFCFKLPDSYSKKKKLALLGQGHQLTPDLDNLVKAVNDTLIKQDSVIYKTNSEKIWGEEDCIIIKAMSTLNP